MAHARPANSPPVRRIGDIAAESVLIAAGGRAILLQLANPGVGRGVAEHSDFASRPLDRLIRTLSYVYTVVYGSPDQIAEAVRFVSRAHAPVRSTARGAAAGYSAFDPRLQLWVAATLYDSAIDLHERVYGPLDDASAEQVYQDYAVLGTALQVPHDLWPANRAAFREYWALEVESLRTDATTRRVAHALLHPTAAPFWLKAGMPVARIVTAALLPPPLREQFDLPWSPARRRVFTALLAVTRVVYPRLPRALRHLPRDRALRDAADRASRR
ncbi:oxygenase MpaB family protein [Agreia sp.]|uniref:oxygenase MpaB family protein n=1 Tax=Agreia sp. TaxID=1872416 RepID=UPI0035BC96F8